MSISQIRYYFTFAKYEIITLVLFFVGIELVELMPLSGTWSTSQRYFSLWIYFIYVCNGYLFYIFLRSIAYHRVNILHCKIWTAVSFLIISFPYCILYRKCFFNYFALRYWEAYIIGFVFWQSGTLFDLKGKFLSDTQKTIYEFWETQECDITMKISWFFWNYLKICYLWFNWSLYTIKTDEFN